MPIAFDGANKRIILDSAVVSAAEIWSRWVDWHASNGQWPVAFRQVGGDSLGGGLFIPPYFFLQNGWRIRPMESSHLLNLNGNLFVDGGGAPVVSTLGAFNVSVQYTVPVQAQGISTSGGSSASDIWDSVDIEGGYSPAEMLRLIAAMVQGNASGLTSGNPSFASIDGSKQRLVATVSNGNRTVTSRDASP